MSMYVDLLSRALVGRVEELTGDDLVGYALVCRAKMLAAGAYNGASAYAALATEVAYDRSLLKLCAAHDIDVVVADFAQPTEERRRIEQMLVAAGLDLAVLARRRGYGEA
jgi:hypothetical protein